MSSTRIAMVWFVIQKGAYFWNEDMKKFVLFMFATLYERKEMATTPLPEGSKWMKAIFIDYLDKWELREVEE